MELGAFEILAVLAILFLSLRYVFLSPWNFWKSRNVKGPRPVPIFGTMKDVFFLKTSTGEYLQRVYRDFPKERVVGIFSWSTPILVVKDVELMKVGRADEFSEFAKGIHGIFHIDIGLEKYSQTHFSTIFEVALYDGVIRISEKVCFIWYFCRIKPKKANFLVTFFSIILFGSLIVLIIYEKNALKVFSILAYF